MSLLIKNWSKEDWNNLLKWAKIGANNAMLGEFAEVEEIPSHGRLIDADVLAAKCDSPHWCVWLSEIDDSPTIIPATED